MSVLKSLLLRLVGITFGPILGMMFGIIVGVIHLFGGECIAPWCPGWWLHVLAVIIGFSVALITLGELFERQNLYEVAESQNSAYFSSGK